MKKYVVFGGFGQLGLSMQKVKPEDVFLYPISRQRIDITDYENVKEYLSFVQPDVVVNAAAHTDVEKAETDFNSAFVVNVVGAATVAQVCEELNIKLIHISSDYVFDGENSQPYSVSDTPNPINQYGKSKLIGEKWVQAVNPSSTVIRTSWVYSEFGHNFAKTILSSVGKGNKEFKVVDDQVGTPTYAPDLAQAIYAYGHGVSSSITGICHYAGSSAISWCSFAKILTSDNKSVIVLPISTNKNKTKRPLYSVLKTSHTELGITPSNPYVGVEETKNNLNN